MPNLERVTKQTSGVLYEELPISSFPAFVQELCKRGIGFPIYPASALHEEEDPDGPRKRPRPLVTSIGTGHGDDLLRISDPDEVIPGVFALDQRSLIYSPHRVLEPTGDRDSYRWSFSSYHYFVDASVVEVLKSYEAEGYSVFRSDAEAFDFRRSNFGDLRQVSVQEILDQIQHSE